MVTDVGRSFPELNALIDRVDGLTRPGESFYLDAEVLAMELFDDHMPANMIVARRRLPARLPAAERGGDRRRDSRQRGGGGEEPRGVRLGPRLRRLTGPDRRGDGAAGGCARGS